jgi:hypothetical protein
MWSWSFARHGLADPLLFHALTAASAVAVIMMKRTPRAMHELVLQHETQAIQCLRREISSTIRKPRDELLFAVLMLMRSNENISTITEPRTLGSFRPPLTQLQHLETGSSLSYRPAQREILKTLVAQKGGLTKVGMPGLAEMFNL